jgi:hypothetical protein
LKSDEIRSFSEAKRLIINKAVVPLTKISENLLSEHLINIKEKLPPIIKEFAENYDYLLLYDEWRRGGTRLNCNSILDSLVILPNGDVPICQNLNVMLGNILPIH